MWFRSLFDALRPRSVRANARQGRRDAARRRPAAGRLWVEPLEERCLPSNYTVTDLGTLGGTISGATDLNASGQVVGWSWTAPVDTDGYPLTHAFVWNAGTMIDLGTLGGPSSSASAINNLGQVVGSATRADGSGSAFLINPEDSNFDGTPDRWFRDANGDGANDLMVEIPVSTAINNLGQVVGGNLLWTPDVPNGTTGTLTSLGSVVAFAINDAGRVVGHFGLPDGGHSALWQDGVVTDLGGGVAIDVNASGQVTGRSGVHNGSYIWTPSTPNGTTGTFTQLPVPPPVGMDYLFGASTSINDAGQVVGNIIFGSNANGEGGEGWSGEAAVQWLGGRMYGLGGLVVPSTQVEAAGAINNAGQIAGTQLVLGAQATYYRRACLLTPLNGPAIAIGDATVTEGHDGTREATFTVTLSAPSTQTVTVGYATANGTASAGSDYESTSGTLTFAPGETSKTVTVPVVGDRAPEPNETFSVRLSSPSSGALADDFGLGTIADDEPRITISDVTLREGRRNKTTLFTFTVTLSTAYDQPVTMSFQTANGTATTGDNDYVARAGTLTFAPGETTRTITIEVKGDSKPEADESFYLDLFGLSSNGLFTRKRGIGTILNDG